jgi:hypothetical protein
MLSNIHSCWNVVAEYICIDESGLRGKSCILEDVKNLSKACKTTNELSSVVLETFWSHLFQQHKYPGRSDMAYFLQDLQLERQWIDLNRVSKYYLLKPADRQGIQTTILFEYGHRWGTRYWNVASCQKKCLEKFGKIDLWQKEFCRLNGDRIKRADIQQKIKLARRIEIEKSLVKRGCHFRTDSRLIQNYVEYGVGDPEEIAVKMQEMNFFHQYTDYPRIFRLVAYRDMDIVDKDIVSNKAKSVALREWASRYSNQDVAKAQRELPPSLKKLL